MDTHRRYVWLFIASLTMIAVLGLALSAPGPVVAQTENTPTLEPPSPRTPPAGPRGTPTPAPVEPTPGPTSQSEPPSDTPAPTPVVMPVAGGPGSPGHLGVVILLMGSASALIVLGAKLARRGNAR